jgi:hypothetical protein
MAEPAAVRPIGARASGPHARQTRAVPEKPFPALPEPVPLARFSAAEDLRAAIGLWAGWLEGERRASAHTVAAYGRDLAFFLDFLTDHQGEPPALATFARLVPADFRAYLAYRAARVERRSRAASRWCAALSAFSNAAVWDRARRSSCCARQSCRTACQSRSRSPMPPK